EGVKGVFRGDRVIAVPGWGGLAERLAVPASSLISMPDGMSFEEAAALTMTYGTSYYALKDRAKLQPGETLLVLGAAGGVGAAAVELGKAMGARVVAAASTNDKGEFALELGADNGLIYPSGPMDKAAQKELSGEFKLSTGRDGADVVFDGVGGDYAEPDAAEVGVGGRRLLGRRRRPRSQGSCREHGRTDAALRRGQDQTARQPHLPAGTRPRGHSGAQRPHGCRQNRGEGRGLRRQRSPSPSWGGWLRPSGRSR